MKVLLPIDASENAQQTLTWASGFLSHEKAEIYLLHVVDLIPDMPRTEYELDQAHALLDKSKAFMASRGFKVADATYIIEEPVRAITEYANEIGVDQIILGSHGRHGLEKLLMGSVSERVFREATQPVLIYRNADQSVQLSRADKVELSEVN